MKQNFTESEFNMVKNMCGTNLNACLNKAGNIKVTQNGKGYFWVLYLTPNNRYLWRKHGDGTYANYCYPLNMRNRNVTDTYKTPYGYTCTYYNFAKHAEFDTVEQAVNYFKNYMKKYHKVSL